MSINQTNMRLIVFSSHLSSCSFLSKYAQKACKIRAEKERRTTKKHGKNIIISRHQGQEKRSPQSPKTRDKASERSCYDKSRDNAYGKHMGPQNPESKKQPKLAQVKRHHILPTAQSHKHHLRPQIYGSNRHHVCSCHTRQNKSRVMGGNRQR